jgi:hypothetical protein
MALKMKRSSVAGKLPTTTQLELGELAVNTYDGRLFLKKDDGTEVIVEIVNSGRLISAGTGLTGGGSLAANRTLAADIASQAEAEAGTVTTKLMTPERVAQAIAALASSGGTSLTAGETIRSRLDAYAQIGSYYYWAERHKFEFAQDGTIRVSFDGASSSSEPVYFRVTRTRNGTETVMASWSQTGTSYVSRSVDVDVAPGDRVSIQGMGSHRLAGKVNYYGYTRFQNCRFKTGGENLIPGVYALVEND